MRPCPAVSMIAWNVSACPHRVASVDQQVHDDHQPPIFLGTIIEYVNVQCAAATSHHLRVQAVGEGDDVVPMIEQGLFCLLRIRIDDHLGLADQNRVNGFNGETTTQSGHPCGAGKSGDDGRFFNHQRHDIVAVVDQEIQGHAHG